VRLGGYCYRPETLAELEDVVPLLDRHGLSAVPAPVRIAEMGEDGARAFGERAAQLDVAIGEAVAPLNLMVRDRRLRTERVGRVRTILRTAEAMGCRGVVVMVGSVAPVDRSPALDPYMFTPDCRAEYREVVLRIIDGLDLRRTRLLIEPWHNTFFYRPDGVLEFLREVGDERVGLHLDQMNMVDQDTYFRTTGLIARTFDLLADYVGSVHLKDVRWDWTHFFIRLDEVPIGDGVLDYDTYVRRLSQLDADLTCYCEHLADATDYEVSFARAHEAAARVGAAFHRRGRDASLRSPVRS
jgi:sugar phosphate isomerase/epimerase